MKEDSVFNYQSCQKKQLCKKACDANLDKLEEKLLELKDLIIVYNISTSVLVSNTSNATISQKI